MSTETRPEVDVRRLARRTGIGLVVFIDLAIVFAAARAPLANGDTYFHLRFGEEFLHHWSVAHPGQLGASSSAQWVPTQWLTEVVWAEVYHHAGAVGLSLLYAALLAATLLATYWSARTRASPVPAVAVASIVLAGSLHWTGLRPQLVSYVLIALTVAAWQRARASGHTPWWLIAMTWVWAMCHGMWILGIATGLAAVAGLALERRDARTTLRHLAVPLLSLVAASCTPAGPRLLLAVAQVGARASDFAEWAPIPLLQGWGLPVTAVLGGIVGCWMRRGRTAPYDMVMLALAVGLAVYSGRTVAPALLVSAPLVAAELQARRPVRAGSTGERLTLAAAFAVLLALGGAGASVREPPLEKQVAPFSARLARLPVGTVVLTDRTTGAVLLLTDPTLDVPVHGYGDVFTDAELHRYDGLLRLEPGWPSTLRELSAHVALLSPDEPLAYALTERGWRTMQRSGGLELLVAPSAEPASVPR